MHAGTCSLALASLAARPPGTETSSRCNCPVSDPRAICHARAPGEAAPAPRTTLAPGERRGIARRGEGHPGNNGTPRSHSCCMAPSSLRGGPPSLCEVTNQPPQRPRRDAPPPRPGPAAARGTQVSQGRPPTPPPRPAPLSHAHLRPAPRACCPRAAGSSPGTPRPPHPGRGDTPAAAAERSAPLGSREPGGSRAGARHLLLSLQAGVEASHGASELPRCPGAGAAAMRVGELGSQGPARTAHARGPVH